MNIRHGDLALIQIDSLPEGLAETDSKVIMTGSHKNDHYFDNGKLYLKNINRFVFGYFVAFSNTKLFHIEHGKKVSNNPVRESHVPQDIYELNKQHEDTNQGMKPVID